MRKLTALLLALTLLFSLVIAVSADEPADGSTTVTLKKLYTVTGANGEGVFPHETLTFTCTPDENNPTNDNLTIEGLEVTGTSGNLVINLPDYTKVGQYGYTISEQAGNAQGVSYTSQSITVAVLVSYDANRQLTAELFLNQKVDGNSSTKVDTFTNTYEVGHLNVKKVVEGNLASQTAEFDVVVTFTSDKPVLSDITYVDDTTKTIAYADGWTVKNNQYTASATITVKSDETVRFTNIPVGVTYAIEEDAKHGLGDDGFNPNSAADTDYTPTYTNQTGTIGAASTVEATITNTKNTDVPTGVELDSMPYILMMTVAVLGMVALVGKKRYEV